MTLKVHCDLPGERTAPETSKFLQHFAQLISSYHQQRALQHNQNIRTYIVSIKAAQPSQPNTNKQELSFPSLVHSALDCSYAAPMQLLSKTSPSPRWLSMGPFATWQQAGTLLAKAATYTVLALPKEPWHGGDSPPMLWCYSASMPKVIIWHDVGQEH